MQIVQFPKIGLATEAATVRELLKHEGDAVEIGDGILTVETEKTTVDVQSSATGRIARYLVAAAQIIPPGTALAVVLGPGEAIDETELDRLLATSVATKKVAAHPADIIAEPAGQSRDAGAKPQAAKASPLVRRRAAQLGIDLDEVIGRGQNRVVTEADVEAHHLSKAPGPATTGRRLTGAAEATAARMSRSWREIPHIHQIIDVDVGVLTLVRRELSVSMTPLLVKAAALALRRHPHINSHFDGQHLLPLESVDIAVAIANEELLLTPRIAHADRLPVVAIAEALEQLRAKLKSQQLTAADLRAGGFTVSNLGMYGIETGTPIINPPQLAIMFVGSVRARPALDQGVLVEQQVMKVTLSYDHRIVHGISAARFSAEIRDLLHKPRDWAFSP